MFELVESCAGHRIERRRPGFEFTPGLLGKLTTYLVRPPGGGAAVFAFMYRFPELATPGASADEVRLAELALATIRQVVESDGVRPGTELTYELREAAWDAVAAPRWWVPAFG